MWLLTLTFFTNGPVGRSGPTFLPLCTLRVFRYCFAAVSTLQSWTVAAGDKRFLSRNGICCVAEAKASEGFASVRGLVKLHYPLLKLALQ